MTENTRKNKKVGTAAAVAAGLIAGGAVAATASGAATATPHRPPMGGAPLAPGRPGGPPGGVLTEVTSTSITVKAPDGSTHAYAITPATTVEKGHEAASASDLAVGERVMVRPETPGSSVAAEVEIAVPHLAGTVISSGSSSIVVADRDGFYRTINVSGSTTYKKGSSSATLSDVTTGEFVMAEGTIDDDHVALDATTVEIGRPSVPLRGDGQGPPMVEG
jgi:hypothetical protein